MFYIQVQACTIRTGVLAEEMEQGGEGIGTEEGGKESEGDVKEGELQGVCSESAVAEETGGAGVQKEGEGEEEEEVTGEGETTEGEENGTVPPTELAM